MEKTTEEKINYIYETLKKQESRYKRALILKWWFKILFILYFIYAYYFILPEYIEKFKDIVHPKVSVESINLDSIKSLFNKN